MTYFRHNLILVLVSFALATAAVAQTSTSGEYRSYLAHIAAASNALRLNETGESKRWIENAPAKHRGWEWAYLDAQANQYVGSRSPHDSPILAIAASPDGSQIASVASDRSIEVTDPSGNTQLFAFKDDKIAPQAITFSPDGKRLLAAFSRHTVIMWDLGTKTEVRRFQGSGKGITAAVFSPDGSLVASCSWDRSEPRGVWGIVEVWNASTGESVKKLEYGVKPLVSIAYSPDGKHLAVASWEDDKLAAIWETDGWKGPDVLETEGDAVYKAGQTIIFSPDSKLVAAGGKDSAVRIWNVDTRKLVRKLTGHAKWVNGITFSPDGKTLASGSTDQTLKLWDVATGMTAGTMFGHTKSINAVAFIRDRILTGSVDGTLKEWHRKSTDQVWKIGESTYGISFSTDGKRFASAASRGKLRMWDADSGRILNEWTGHGSSANAVAYSPDGKRLASVGNDGKIKIWDTTNYQELRTLETVTGVQLVSVAFSPDGKQVFSAASGERARLWNLETGEAVREFPHAGGVFYIAVSPDGKLGATGGSDGSVKVWSLADGHLVGTFAGPRARIACLSFSRDSKWIGAAIGRAGVLFDAATLKRSMMLNGHDEAVHGISFSPDGKRVLTSSSDMTFRLWDPATGENVLSIPSEGPPWNAMFHPDGKRLFLLPLDQTVRTLGSTRNLSASLP